jgi:hypothetical protein
VPFLTRHKAPVLQVAWRPCTAAGGSAADGTDGRGVLHSLCGAGCLLRWDQHSAAVRICSLRLICCFSHVAMQHESAHLGQCLQEDKDSHAAPHRCGTAAKCHDSMLGLLAVLRLLVALLSRK